MCAEGPWFVPGYARGNGLKLYCYTYSKTANKEFRLFPSIQTSGTCLFLQNSCQVDVSDVFVLTCEGFKLVLQVKHLFARGSQVYTEFWAHGVLLYGSTDQGYFVSDCLLGLGWFKQKHDFMLLHKDTHLC